MVIGLLQPLPWVRPGVEKATLSAENAPECARRWETTTDTEEIGPAFRLL
jgi:hypothetical protein